MKGPLIVALILVAAPAGAEDCAKYADALAYNACLARQGPAARAVHLGAAPVGRAAPPPRAGRVRGAIVVRRGRSELIFSPRR